MPFAKGNRLGVGNKGGRPTKDRRAIFAAMLPDADKQLKAMVKGKDKRLALEACKVVYDRALGKAKEQVDINLTDARRFILGEKD